MITENCVKPAQFTAITRVRAACSYWKGIWFEFYGYCSIWKTSYRRIWCWFRNIIKIIIHEWFWNDKMFVLMTIHKKKSRNRKCSSTRTFISIHTNVIWLFSISYCKCGNKRFSIRRDSQKQLIKFTYSIKLDNPSKIVAFSVELKNTFESINSMENTPRLFWFYLIWWWIAVEHQKETIFVFAHAIQSKWNSMKLTLQSQVCCSTFCTEFLFLFLKNIFQWDIKSRRHME